MSKLFPIKFIVIFSTCLFLACLFLACLFLATPALAGDNRLDELNANTRDGVPTKEEKSVLSKIMFYLPNRVLDLIDIFRADVGLGASGGAVVRGTRYGQFGYRYVDPLSFRLGLRGREVPFFYERYSEYGFGSDFQQSENRFVTPYEFGIGVDVLVGVYVGISFDEIWDFFSGWVLYDPSEDDLG